MKVYGSFNACLVGWDSFRGALLRCAGGQQGAGPSRCAGNRVLRKLDKKGGMFRETNHLCRGCKPMIKHMTWDNIQYFEKAFLVCYDIIVLKRGFQLIRCVRLTHIMTGALALKLHHEKSAEILHAMKSREVSGEDIHHSKKKSIVFFDCVKIIFSSSFRRNLFQEEFLEFLARREFFVGSTWPEWFSGWRAHKKRHDSLRTTFKDPLLRWSFWLWCVERSRGFWNIRMNKT